MTLRKTVRDLLLVHYTDPDQCSFAVVTFKIRMAATISNVITMGVNSKMQVSLQITKPFQSATGHRKILQRLLAAQISLMTKEWEATEVLNRTS